MSKFISDSDEWNKLYLLWNKTDIVDKMLDVNNVIDNVNTLLNGVSLSSVSKISTYDINNLKTQFEDNAKYCKEIHTKVEEKIDDPFCYGLAKAADEAYMINPKELTVTDPSGGTASVSIIDILGTIPALDEKLKKAFDEAVTKVEALEPSADLQQAILDSLMRYYKGTNVGSLIPQEDIDLLLLYYKMLYPVDYYGIDNFAKLFSATGVYDSELDALNAIAVDMRNLTDQRNVEHMVIITVIETNGKKQYVTSEVIPGVINTVMIGTIAGALFKSTVVSQILVHTHPKAEGWGENNFSGDPGNISNFGDTTVTNLFGYDSIYLLAPNGNIYKYEGYGTNPYQANNAQELLEITDGTNNSKRPPIVEDIAPAKVQYLKDPVTGEYFPVATIK